MLFALWRTTTTTCVENRLRAVITQRAFFTCATRTKADVMDLSIAMRVRSHSTRTVFYSIVYPVRNHCLGVDAALHPVIVVNVLRLKIFQDLYFFRNIFLFIHLSSLFLSWPIKWPHTILCYITLFHFNSNT